MKLIAHFYDYSDDGIPQFAIQDEYENILFTIPVPPDIVESFDLEIGDEFLITPHK